MDILTKENSIVMCKITSINDYSYGCKLIENWGYELNGEILFTDITNKKMRVKPEKFFTINKILPLRIIHKTDKIISLSKIQIDKDENAACTEKFTKYRILDSILQGITHIYNKDINDLYNTIIYPILNDTETPLDTLINSIDRNFDNMIEDELIVIKLRNDINDKFLKTKVKMICKLKLTSNAMNGVNIIKEALTYGAQSSLSIYLDSPPNYIITYETKDQDYGRKYIGTTVEKIRDKMLELGGMITVGEIEIL